MTSPNLSPYELALERLTDAARDRSRVVGYTHNFYRYPARFSPTFAAAAIELFSQPGDIVLDPYMGGGTVIVEAAARNRFAVGNDLNTLAVFLARAKTTCLAKSEVEALAEWATAVTPKLNYRSPVSAASMEDTRTKNLN